MTKGKIMLATMLMALPLAASPAAAQMHAHAAGEQNPAAMTGTCRALAEKQQAMQGEMFRNAERLKELQAKLNSARGEEKTAALVEAVNTLIDQQQAMQAKMSTMMPEMMQHMADHMSAGMMQGMQESMRGCMMMQKGGMQEGMGGKDGNGGHAGQH